MANRPDDIIRSAYQVMARRGSHRLSLQDIASEAGVSKGLLLYHFGTKDNLLLATMRWALQGTADRIRRRVAKASGSEQAIVALIEAIFVSPQANRDFYMFYLDLLEHQVRVPSFRTLAEMLDEIINGLYVEVIQRGQHDGVFAVEDVRLTARHMRALIEGTFLQWLQSDDWEKSHAQWRDECRRALLRLLGAPLASRTS
ncbi:MAG: TetR/AcrR family transcriptional regulator [Acidimicrobiia bacterium]